MAELISQSICEKDLSTPAIVYYFTSDSSNPFYNTKLFKIFYYHSSHFSLSCSSHIVSLPLEPWLPLTLTLLHTTPWQNQLLNLSDWYIYWTSNFSSLPYTIYTSFLHSPFLSITTTKYTNSLTTSKVPPLLLTLHSDLFFPLSQRLLYS